jgi:hypothetical protein
LQEGYVGEVHGTYGLNGVFISLKAVKARLSMVPETFLRERIASRGNYV